MKPKREQINFRPTPLDLKHIKIIQDKLEWDGIKPTITVAIRVALQHTAFEYWKTKEQEQEE